MSTLSKKEAERVALWAHCVSAHCAIIAPDETLDELISYHEHEHAGPGTIRGHELSDRSFSLKKIGEVLSEADE